MTCYYRCGNACDHPEPNPTDHPRFRDLVEASLARRAVLRGGAVATGLALVGASVIGLAFVLELSRMRRGRRSDVQRSSGKELAAIVVLGLALLGLGTLVELSL